MNNITLMINEMIMQNFVLPGECLLYSYDI